MEFCFLWTNTVDQLDSSGAPETNKIPMGYTSILTNSGVPFIQTVNIEIKAGSYSPSSLVELFNRQTLMPTYLNYAKDGKIYNPPANAAVFGNSLPFNTIAEFVPSTNAFLLYTPGVSTVFDPDYGYQITSDMDTTGLYSIPMAQPLIYGSNGFTLNFDSNTQRFSILSNFMPITSTDSNSLVVLRMNDANTPGGRIFIDRTGEVLVQRWGYTISEWKNSFWYRLGFEWSDLIKTSPTDKNLFGRVYADINNLAVNQTIPQSTYASNGLQALNLQQGAILMADSGNNAYKAMSYDGNNLPIIASKSPNLIPLGYCRARLDLQIVGGGSNGLNLYGFTQAISLLNISAAGITSFSILNPCPFMFASDMNIKSIRVFLQDPRNDSRLSWISKQNLSALFLRIQQPIS